MSNLDTGMLIKHVLAHRREEPPQNHKVNITSCARTAINCANRGLVSTAVQEDAPQPTLDATPSSERLKDSNIRKECLCTEPI